MKQSQKFVGKVLNHSDLGKVTVDSIHKDSRVLVDVTVIERGKGWDEVSQTYKGVRISTGWYRGENKSFGSKDTVHIKDLK